MGPPDEADESGTRRHAVWGLSILAMVAVVLVSITVLFGGGPDNAHRRAGPPLPTMSYSSPGGVSPSGSGTSAPPSTSARLTPKSTPPSTTAAALVSTTPPTTGTAPPPPPPPSSSAPAGIPGQGLHKIGEAIYQYRSRLPNNFPISQSAGLTACASTVPSGGTAPVCTANISGWVSSVDQTQVLVRWLDGFTPSVLDTQNLQSCGVGWAEHPEHPSARYFVAILCTPRQSTSTGAAPSSAPASPSPTA